MQTPPEFTPLVLLVDDQEWTSRSIESILRPQGHVVLKAYTGRQALDLVNKVSPDGVIVDLHLPDIDGMELVRRLRASDTIGATTPLLMITSSILGRAERLEVLGSGAWDILTHPVDPNELLLRMHTFVRAKHEADRLRDEGLLDPSTGFYNVRGILRRANEISADAVRSDRPMACVAFGPRTLHEEGPEENEQYRALVDAISRRVASSLRSVTRGSDTVGRLGPSEFVVVAPDTGRQGAGRLADRVLEAAEQSGDLPGLDPMDPEMLKQIRAGFCTVTSDLPAPAEDLLLRATLALRRAQVADDGFRVLPYEA